MNKKKLLFVIDSLTIGGAEKSLLSLLNMIDATKFSIDLLLFKQGLDLEKYVPNHINILPVPEYFRYLNKEQVSVRKKPVYLFYRIRTSVNLRLNQYKSTPIHSEQVVYRSSGKVILPTSPKTYDIAIAYSQGMPTYFVANKVTALKKLAWINTDYVNTLYDKEIDYESYKRINKIIAVSQHTRDSVSKIREEYKNKVQTILDIVNPEIINQMAEEHKVEDFNKSITNILTVGRLASAKSYDKAIETARLLKQHGYSFKWYVIGEGPERNKLEELIAKYQLENNFILLGKKVNPYPYMKNCDLYVQTSIKEGFGLTVCEAKILKRPIVCTDFPTAKEIITNNKDGLIVQHDVNSIFSGIRQYLDDDTFKDKIVRNLAADKLYSSVNQLDKFYELIEK
ncbi:glycosyltransferase [Paenibacillus sp. GCM10023248]|uniref:glycosyltransferase n=1 Tax=unclassified Paenibacillus TaxID=185978 RepID=UPI002378AB5A|nr:glycosyltransferase [Paenibacillus sp. MAHUQ-63]MDD9266528.1 glycosyltransferase [Paenibacillus sp. MAHUQ-63]